MKNKLNLLEKTELWVHGITLDNANLTDMAKAVSGVLGLADDKVMVMDVRPEHITFDLVQKEIQQENIIGKAEALLDALAAVPGVRLTEDSFIHSDGILGLIYADSVDKDSIAEKVSVMTEEIVEKISRRAIVFPTGFELEQKLIEDTNTPYLKALLEAAGYKVTTGDVIPDSEYIMTEILQDAVNRGFGLIITSGGIGAEDKDFSVESVLNVDPDAVVSYVVKYKRGEGRHVKDGVRVAVGKAGLSILVTLPGPHDEVEMTAPALVKMLASGHSKREISDTIAGILAGKWRNDGKQHMHMSHYQ